MSITQRTPPQAVAASSRATVWVVFVASVLGGLVTLGLGTASIVTSAVAGRITLALATLGTLPAEADAGTARLVTGQYESAQVTVENLTPGTLASYLSGQAIGVLTQVAVAAALAVLCWSLLRPAPFRRSLSGVVVSAGAVVLIGGMLQLGLSTLSSWRVADQLNGSDTGPGTGDLGFWPIMTSVDATFVGVGVALLLVGLAFEYGERLQRDTAGLV